MNKTLLGSIIGVLLLGVIMFSIYASYNNREITLRKQVLAEQEVCKANFDKMWKIISQKAQVADKYKDSFKDIYIGIMDGRYKSGGGEFMKWIQESNPNFDTSIFIDLSRSIENQRTEYFTEQKKLIDIQREHATYISVLPQSLFLSSRGEVKIEVITSANTDNVYKSGQENDVKVF